MVSIVQRVSAHFPCTWEDALDFRRDHIGTTEQAIQSLIYLKNQNQHQMQNYHNQQNLSSVCGRDMALMNQMGMGQAGLAGYQLPQTQLSQGSQSHIRPNGMYYNHQNSRNVVPNCLYPDTSNNIPVAGAMNHNGQPYWTPTDTHQLQSSATEIGRLKMLQKRQDYPITPVVTTQFANGLNPNSCVNGQSMVPTGNLIEVSSPPIIPPKRMVPQNQQQRSSLNRESSSSSTSTLPGQGGPIPLTVKQLEDENRRKSVLEAAASAVTQGTKNSLESWDYVYRQLENSGYTKDQADRPDVLELLIKQLQIQKEQQQYAQTSQPEENLRSTQRVRNGNQSAFNEPKDDAALYQRTINTEKLDQPDATHRRFNHSHKELKHGSQKRAVSSASKYLDTARYDDDEDSDSEQPIMQIRAKSSSSLAQQKDRPDRYNKPLEPPNSAMAPPQLPPKGRHQKRDTPSPCLKEQYSEEENVNKWECQFCTFLNEGTIDICEMCAKSRLISESSRTTLNSPTRNSHQSQHYRSQSALSHNSSLRSSRQTTTQGSSNAYYSEEEDFHHAKQLSQERSFDMVQIDNLPQKHKTASTKIQRDLYPTSNMQDDAMVKENIEGIECIRCTLVNDKTLKICEACGASLGLAPIESKRSHSRHANKSDTGNHG